MVVHLQCRGSTSLELIACPNESTDILGLLIGRREGLARIGFERPYLVRCSGEGRRLLVGVWALWAVWQWLGYGEG